MSHGSTLSNALTEHLSCPPLDESSPPSVFGLYLLVINIMFYYYRNERNVNALSEKQLSVRNRNIMRGVHLSTALIFQLPTCNEFFKFPLKPI